MDRSKKLRHVNRRFLFRPMALALVFLMMPHGLPWLGNLSLVPAAHATTVATPPNCVALGGSYIIRYVCQGLASDAIQPSSDLVNAVKQFENDSINMYMAAHNIPNNDTQNNAFFYTFARSSLRTEVRAFMQLRLADIANRPAASRTANETAIYTWIQERLWSHEKHMYQSAVDDRNHWQNDRCGWKPDTDVSNLLGIHYVACVGTVTYGTAPTKDYFLRAARKTEYDSVLANLPGGLELFWQTNGKLIETLGLAPASGIVAGVAAVAILSSKNVLTKVFPKTVKLLTEAILDQSGKLAVGLGEKAVEDSITRAGAELLAEEEVAEIVPGFEIVIGLATFVITEVVQIVVEEAIAEETLKELDTLNSNAHSTPPDLAQLLTTDEGRWKIDVVWTETWTPEVAATTPLPTPGPGDPVLLVTPEGSKVPQVATGLDYLAPTGVGWIPQLYGGWFVQTGYDQRDLSHPIHQLTPTIHYMDWNNVPYTASRIGQYFVVAKEEPNPTDDVCTAPQLDPDVANYPPLDTCRSYVAAAIKVLTNPEGKHVALSVGVPPKFTSGLSAFFTNLSGSDLIPACFPLTATGFPAPQITLASGTLPSGMALGTCSNSLSLTANHPAPGFYVVMLQATNAAGSVQQRLTIDVGDNGTQLAFPDISLQGPGGDGGRTWTLGVPMSYTWHVTGGPPPIQITTNYTWPVGLTFHDNGDGSATLSGTPTAYPASIACPGGCVLTATNGLSTATTQFGYVLNQPPASVLTGGGSFLFPANIPHSVTVTTSNVLTPVSIDAPCGYTPVFTPFNAGGGLPPWASLHDNGDGTATISGTAPFQDAGILHPVHLRVSTAYVPQESPPACRVVNFAITVDPTPVMTTPAIANFTVGQSSSFIITSNLPAGLSLIALGSPLPAGLQFFGGADGTASIQGNPQPGTGRDYSLRMGASVQGTVIGYFNLLLRVAEAPDFTLPSTVYFNAGQPNTFFVKPKGFPKFQGMSIVLDQSPLPSGVTFTAATPITTMAGVGTLQGTPDPGTVGMSYSLRIIATNSGGTVTRSTILQVVAPQTAMGGSFSTLKTGPQNARVWTVNIGNNGPGAADGAEVTSFTVAQLSAGTQCTPKVTSDLPAVAGDIAPKATGAAHVTIDFTGCAPYAYFKVTAGISANNGAVTGTITRFNQFQ
jgi:hypothetical protein